MRMRKLFAGLAAAATLLSGLAIGASTANADDATAATDPQLGTTLTIKADDGAQLAGRTFTVYKLASYDQYTGTGTVGLTTVPDGTGDNEKVYSQVQAAVTEATKNATDKANQYAATDSDPLAWAAQAAGRLDRSGTSPWTGLTRTLAETLDVTKLGTATQTVNVTAAQVTAKSVVIDNLQPGLYFVVDTTASQDAKGNDLNNPWTNSLRMVAGTKLPVKDAAGNDLADGEIKIKNQTLPIHKQVVKDNASEADQAQNKHDYKSEDNPDYAIGATVPYELTSTVPVYTGYEKPGRTYQIVDTLSKGLTYDKVESVKVTSADGQTTQTLVVGTDYTVTKDDTLTSYANQQDNTQIPDEVKNGKATKVTINFSNYVNEVEGAQTLLENGKVTVILKATLNSDAVISTPGSPSANPNKVDLVYSNNPEDVSNKTTVPGGEVNVYSFRFQVKKVAKDGSTPLPGAQFKVKDSDGKYLLRQDEQDQSGNWKWSTTTDKTQAQVFTSGEDGSLTPALTGLDADTYTVEETKAPEGYQSTILPSFTVTITPTYEQDTATKPSDQQDWGDHTVKTLVYSNTKDAWSLVSADDKTNNYSYTVKNVKNVTQLPLTGAAGIALFGIIGLLLAGAAATVYAKSRSTKRALRA